MCGIAGFRIAPGDIGKINTELVTFVLGLAMQERGRDATGIYTADVRGRWRVRKNPIKAEVFLAGKAGIGKNATTALIHARAATQGLKSNPKNNHPIIYGNHVGIHNGIVGNDDALYDHYNWERLGQVDSEAIFAALDHLTYSEALTSIVGSWAIAWANTGFDPNQLWLARGDSSPLYYAETENGSVVFASTHSAVKEAFEWGGITGTPAIKCAYEGFLARTEPEGGLTVCEKFDGSGKDAPGYKPRTYTTYSSGTTTNNRYKQGDKWLNGIGYVSPDEYDEWYALGYRNTSDSYVGPTGNRTERSTVVTNRTELPMVNVRQWIKGDRKAHAQGDVRKFRNEQDNWVYELCTVGNANDSTVASTWRIVGQRSCWDQRSDAQALAGFRLALPVGPVIDDTTVAQVTVTTDTQREATERGVVLPFDQESDEGRSSEGDPLGDREAWKRSEQRYGHASEGDFIAFPLRFLDMSAHKTDYLVGEVLEIEDDELIVRFAKTRINTWAEYEVVARTVPAGA